MGEHAEMSHLDTSVTAGLDSMESNAKLLHATLIPVKMMGLV